MLGINIGSGQRPFKSTDNMTWVNVDCNERWQPDVVANGDSLPMFHDGEADYVVLHHCYEHMTLDQARATTQEAHRILKPTGSLLIFVPNLEELVDAWKRGKIDDYIFCVNLHGAYMGDEADIHRWSYTRRSLKDRLTNCASWRSVLPFDWRQIEGADIARDWWILSTEAIK